MDSFKSFGLPKSLEKSLEKLKLDKPTQVQIESVPEAISGNDVVVSAPTGTGKTLAFSLPIVNKLVTTSEGGVIIITPTREIATQINTVIQSLLHFDRNIKPILLIGGAPISKQFMQLRNIKHRLIIGTPGRINDHLERKSLSLLKTDLVVLDEMDRMLDMGFSVQIDEIFKFLAEKKQVLMFSATIPAAILKTSQKYLNNPKKVTIDAKEIVNTSIKQEFIHVAKEEKYQKLLDELEKREGTKIIFVKTRRNAEELEKKLKQNKFKAKAIHGGLRQHQREKIIRLFRNEEYDIVIGTDVAARGIDVPHIKHVINYNLPTNPEDYVHRVGRTGRAGKEGYSLCFISSNENKEWYALDRFLNPDKKIIKKPDNNRRGSRGKFSNKRGASNGEKKPFFSRGKFKGKDNKSSKKPSNFSKKPSFKAKKTD
jgi:ATP-dependent RNA helicase DeaD